MHTRQHMQLHFCLRKNKQQPAAPSKIYVRITINGYSVEISLRENIPACHWNESLQRASKSWEGAERVNKMIMETITDLDRHFHMCLTKYDRVLPEMVKRSYFAPSPAAKAKKEKAINFEFSIGIDETVERYVNLFNKFTAWEDRGYGIHPEQAEFIENQRTILEQEIGALKDRSLEIFDNKEWEKTFMLAVN